MTFSLIESKLILPSHLKHLRLKNDSNAFARFQTKIADGLELFIQRIYQPTLNWAVAHRAIVLSGFGTEDNHHFISGFQWGPDGRLYFGQGLFLHTQVETPYGPVRAHVSPGHRGTTRLEEAVPAV